MVVVAACGGERPVQAPAPVAAGGAIDAAGSAAIASGAPGGVASGVVDAGAPATAAVVDAAAAAVPDPGIVDWPIAWSDERARLTLDYRRAHSDPDAADLTIDPHMIVLHYTAGSSAKGTHGYFDNVRLEAARTELARGGAVNVSAHFLVDRDGTIYRLQPETRMARHCIGLNHVAIGVENVGDPPRLPLTAAQIDADAALVRWLASRYSITHLIGHLESRRFEGTSLWVERDPKYRNEKPDPGAAFMRAVRAKVADLDLAGPPP
jgi:N-acetylmuramoyl-L-alanine amidase